MKPLDIELFAGAGGMAVGLRNAGMSPQVLFEIDHECCETLRENFSRKTDTIVAKVQEVDVRSLDWSTVLTSPVRLLAAGIPCQPFSVAGKHQAHEDSRNLFPELMRAIRCLRPAAVLIENVGGLVRSRFQRYFDYMLRQLEYPSIGPRSNEEWDEHHGRLRQHKETTRESAEYVVMSQTLNAADFGVPQIRHRVFIVALRTGLPQYHFPSPSHSRESLLETQMKGDYWAKHGLQRSEALLASHTIQTPTDTVFLPWRTVRDAIADLPAPSHSEHEARGNHWHIHGARSYKGHVGSVLDWPSKAIKAGVHGVPGGENTVVQDDGTLRYFTLREAARLQTFPDNHLFHGARAQVTKQVGNAVPCRLAEAIARSLSHILNSCEGMPVTISNTTPLHICGES